MRYFKYVFMCEIHRGCMVIISLLYDHLDVILIQYIVEKPKQLIYLEGFSEKRGTIRLGILPLLQRLNLRFILTH